MVTHGTPYQVGILLQPAGVGEDDARVRGQRGEIQVAERLEQADVGRGSMSCSASAARVRGCRRECRRARSGPGSSASTIRPRRGCATFASQVDGRDHICPWLQAEAAQDRRALAGDQARAGWTRPPSRLPRPRSVPPRLPARAGAPSARLGRAGASDVRSAPRRGCAPPASTVPAPHAGFDVRRDGLRLRPRRARRQCRRGVAVHERPGCGPLGGYRVEDPWPHRRDHLLVRQAADPEAVRGCGRPSSSKNTCDNSGS